MLIKLICWLWGHKTTAIGQDMPVVITDFRFFKGENIPRKLTPDTLQDINLSMLPPGMRLDDAFFVGPSLPHWQRLSFCTRCGRDAGYLPAVMYDNRVFAEPQGE